MASAEPKPPLHGASCHREHNRLLASGYETVSSPLRGRSPNMASTAPKPPAARSILSNTGYETLFSQAGYETVASPLYVL